MQRPASITMQDKIRNHYQRSLVDELKRFSRAPVRVRVDARRVEDICRKLRRMGILEE